MHIGRKLAAIVAAIVLAVGLCPTLALGQQPLPSGKSFKTANQITISPLPATGKALTATSDAATFAVLPEAKLFAAVEGDEIVYTLKLGIENGLYSAVRYPTQPLSAESGTSEGALANGNLSMQMHVHASEADSFGSASITMKFFHVLANRWVERTVAIDLDASTLAIEGPELDADAIKAMIASLPVDPLDVAEGNRVAIEATLKAYNAASDEDREKIDQDRHLGDNPYIRTLESSIWALDSLKKVENNTKLPDGTYTNKATSKCSLGTSTSARQRMFVLKKIVVEGGKLYGIIEHQTNASDIVFIGGASHHHTNTDEKAHSTFRIPIVLNADMHLIQLAKNPTEETIGIAYELRIEMDESAVAPDAAPGDDGGGSGGNDGGAGAGENGDAGTGKDNGSGAGENDSGSGSGSSGKSGDNGSGKSGSNDNGNGGAGSDNGTGNSGGAGGTGNGGNGAGGTGSNAGGNGNGNGGAHPSSSGAAGLLASLQGNRSASAGANTGANTGSSAQGQASASANVASASDPTAADAKSAAKTESKAAKNSPAGSAPEESGGGAAASAGGAAAPTMPAGAVGGMLAGLALLGGLAFLLAFQRRERQPARRMVG